jgi:hypothetical protein
LLLKKIPQRSHRYHTDLAAGIKQAQGAGNKIFQHREAGLGGNIAQYEIPGLRTRKEGFRMGAEDVFVYAVPAGIIGGKNLGKLIPVLGADRDPQSAGGAYAQDPGPAAGIQRRAGHGPARGRFSIKKI